MLRPYDPTETAVVSDLKTMHTDVYDPIRPASACRVESGQPVCGQLDTASKFVYNEFDVSYESLLEKANVCTLSTYRKKNKFC